MHNCGTSSLYVNTLRTRQNCHHFADDLFKRIFWNESVRIPIKISLKFVPKCQINNIPALVQIMAWRQPGDKPLSEPMIVGLPMHICITRLTHSCLNQMSAILQACSDASSWRKFAAVWYKFHWHLLPRAWLTISQLSLRHVRPTPLMTQLTDAYMQHPAPMCHHMETWEWLWSFNTLRLSDAYMH